MSTSRATVRFPFPRSTPLQETSGFLLGQEYPPLPLPASLSDAIGGEVLPPAEQSDQSEACTPHKPEIWCRRWYMLRRGKLSAFSGWGVGHSCVGRLPLYGCSVEDALEIATAGEAPFAFRVRARCVAWGEGLITPFLLFTTALCRIDFFVVYFRVTCP